MSPIENVVPAHLNERVEVTLRNKQDRSRDLFGVQLEVTSLLLEAERRKLSVLQKELQIALEEGGSIKAKEHQKQELLAAIARIQAQHDHLDKEYREHALGALISANSRGIGKVSSTFLSEMAPQLRGLFLDPPLVWIRGSSSSSVLFARRLVRLEMQERERPKIAPKPIIAAKPKYVPPVKLQHKVPPRPPPMPGEPRDPGGPNMRVYFESDKVPLYHHKKALEANQKPPNSPSTVCCSILSNAATDCYGSLVQAKLSKLDSVDSTSSDSGGFKDFHYHHHHHQRKSSQPDFLLDRSLTEANKPLMGHQRKTSQPTFKGSYIPNAQALAPFLPQTEQKILMHQQARKPLLSHQSTRKLEELLAQRLERERLGGRKASMGLEGGQEEAEEKMRVQRQVQQKLHQDLEETVKQMQEMRCLEYRLPQNRKWGAVESNRSQPAIGLKHPLKSRGSFLDIPPSMDDPEIQETVEAILGKGVKVVDCEKKSSIREEEVLYINGIPVTLEGRDGLAIKEALITGQVPPCDLLNKLLIDTGILKAPVKLDTSLSVKSTTVIKEEVTVSRDGKIVDERSRETKDQQFYTSAMTEIFEPIKIIPTAELTNDSFRHNKFCSSSSTSSYESEHEPPSTPFTPPRGPRQCLSKDSGHMSSEATQMSNDSLSSYDETDDICDRLLGQELNRCATYVAGGGKYANGYLPTIFGTVAPSDLTSKDCSNRRSLPQTPTIKSYSTIFSASGDPQQDPSGDSGIQQDNALVYRDGNLLSGPLEALILHMVPTESYYPDRAYLFAFLLSARLFIKPHDLLSKVRTLGDQQQGLGPPLGGSAPTSQQMRFAEKMVQLLAEWTEQFPYDFRDERMMEHVRKVTQQCCVINPTLRTNVSLLLHNLHPKLASLEEYEKLLENQTNTASSDEHISCPDMSEVCQSPEKLAQQLTHVELERLSFIGPEEFVQAFAKENPALETSFKDLKKTRNLEQYVQWFNRLSYFVATQVCKYQKKKQRVKMVEYWIETGRECFNIGNFNSLMAIIAGLNMSPISRLKKTWNKIQSGKFAILEHQMDPSSNFSSYRSTLKAAMWRSAGATDQRQRIVIPFFSLLVKDLYFLNQGCSNKLPNGHINFEKFWQLAKQVTEFMAWKQVTCPFERDPKVISLLQHSPVLNENALALASFECEPPENNQEKERCKSLKAEGGSNTN